VRSKKAILRDASGGGGRTPGEEGRRLRQARGVDRVRSHRIARALPGKENRRLGGAGGQCGERIAQQPALGVVAMRMSAVKVDELAELVDVLDRVLERRLPAGKQRENEKKST
jgi:hypothetical protein